MQRKSGGASRRNYDVDGEASKLIGVGTKALRLFGGKAFFERYVVSIEITMVLQALQKCRSGDDFFHGIRRMPQHANARDFLTILGTRGPRATTKGSSQSDCLKEISAFHLISSSARATTEGGMVRPCGLVLPDRPPPTH
jgi:hypothetical protein